MKTTFAKFTSDGLVVVRSPEIADEDVSIEVRMTPLGRVVVVVIVMVVVCARRTMSGALV